MNHTQHLTRSEFLTLTGTAALSAVVAGEVPASGAAPPMAACRRGGMTCHQFPPEAQRRRVGLIAMKPLASGAIVKLDPRAKMETAPEFPNLELWQQSHNPILPAVVAELAKSLNRRPDETLCLAAMRFVYPRSFITSAISYSATAKPCCSTLGYDRIRARRREAHH